ncbi:hypothetical protein HYU19_02630 [Candidatus Woesearchaeota archaeon]|nr:hypothetical protein [Candidatus Woesearchaeota archaeon]
MTNHDEDDEQETDDLDDGLDISGSTKKDIRQEQHREKEVEGGEAVKGVGTKSNLYFAIIAVAAILIVALIIFLPPFLKKQERPKTINELHDDNLQRLLPPEQGYLYNGFSFVNVDESWYTRFLRKDNGQHYSVQLRYGPRQLQHVPIDGNSSTILKYNATYITFDPTLNNLSYVALAAADISTSLVNIFNVTPVAACTKNESKGCWNRPIVTCEDPYPIIMIEQDPILGVRAIGSCLIVGGKGFGLLEATDRLLLAWFGIMP